MFLLSRGHHIASITHAGACTCSQTCGPSREQRWKRQAGPNPRWCCSCGEVDTSRTDGTDPESHRAGSFQHRCPSWGITVKLGIHILSGSYWKGRCGRATGLVIKTATSWWAGCVSLWGLRFFCQAQKLDRVVSAWWTIFNPFCNTELN